MNKGSVFQRDGRTYEIIQDGVAYVEKNREACIKPKGSSRCLTVVTALRRGLIRETPSGEIGAQPAPDLFAAPRDKRPANLKDKKAAVSEGEKPQYPEPPKERRLPSDNTYFMPVDELRAQVFLSHGLIFPPVYDKPGAASNFADQQTLSPAELLIFDTSQPLRKGQVLLKILLHPDEVADADRAKDTLRFAMPLPISRLVGIALPASAGDVERFVDGWVKPDVPVPRHLFSGDAPEAQKNEDIHTHDTVRDNAKPSKETAESIAKFDRYLGVMAFLRNTARYFSQKCGQYADYPDAYLSLASAVLGDPSINPVSPTALDPFLAALLDLGHELHPDADQVLSLAKCQDPYIEKEKAHGLAMEVYKTAEKSKTLASAFNALFIRRDYRSAIRDLQDSGVPPEAAILAGLYKFSNRQAGDYRTVKQRLHEDWNDVDQVNPVMAALGSFHGYTAMDALETSLYSVHPLIKEHIEERPPIKFHLTTRFERQLIEALYQRAFYNPKDHNRDGSALYSGISAVPPPPVCKPKRILVKDTSYTVRDLLIRRYEVTLIGRLVYRLMLWNRDFIDEQSEAGRCLMAQCFFRADEYELSCKGGRQTLRYKISKSKLIDLIANDQIKINPCVLEAALQADSEEVGT